MAASLIVLEKSGGTSYMKAGDCWVKMKHCDVLWNVSQNDIKAGEV